MIDSGTTTISRRRPWIRRLIKAAVLLFIFGAGAVSGMLYGIHFSFQKMDEHAENMNELPDNAIPRLAEEFALTPEQLPEFDRIFRKHYSEIARAQGENAIKAHQHWAEMGKEMLPLLNETQAAAFRETHRKICTVFLPHLPRTQADGAPTAHPCEEVWKSGGAE